MKTDQLVRALVADRAASAAPLRRTLAGALAAGLLVTLPIFALEFGPRVDLGAALATWRFDLKLALVLLAFAAAFGACMALSRPLSSAAWRRLAWTALAAAVAALAIELAIAPRQSWGTRLIGTNAFVCLTTIPLFAAAPLAGLLWAMRRTAPRSPTLAGAAAGLLAAAPAPGVCALPLFGRPPPLRVRRDPPAAVPPVPAGSPAGHSPAPWGTRAAAA
ncbi:MAG: DUF1109 family protein, partial [Reyranella sp.]|nr:DUF1109 family protein [Reyranella sp.]